MDIPKLMVLTAEQFRLLLGADPDGFYERDNREQLLRLIQKLENFQKDCSRPEMDLYRRHQRKALGLHLKAGSRHQHAIEIDGGLLVEGSQQGDLHLGGGLVVADGGKVKGNIQAASVVCRGKIKGDIKAAGTVHLCAKGQVDGCVEAATLQIEDGARFTGHCRLEPDLKPPPPSTWDSVKKLLGMASS